MQRTPLLILAVALLPGVQAVALEFHAPFQAQGDAAFAGEWVLLTFPPAAPTAFEVEALGAVATNHSMLRAVARTQVPEVAWPQTAPLPDEGHDVGDFSAGLAANGRQWGSLFVVADRVLLNLSSKAALHAEAGPQVVAHFEAQPPSPVWTYRDAIRIPGPGAVASVEDGAFTLLAEGLRRVEWHEVAVACRQGACPDGAQGSYERRDGPVGYSAERRHYLELATDGGTLRGGGAAFRAVVGSAAMDLAVDGTTRLPGARLGGEEIGTVTLEGEVRLAGLAPSADGFAADVSGRYTGARLDEAAVDPALLGGLPPEAAALAVAGGLAALYALARYAPSWLALLVRDQGVAMRNGNRKELLRLIAGNPGISQRQLHRLSGLARGTVEKHVTVLIRVGKVVREPMGNTWRYFEARGAYGTGQRKALAVLRDGDLHWLHGKVRALGPATQADVIAAVAREAEWPASSVQYRLQKLAAAGLLETWTQHGRRWYKATSLPSTGAATLGVGQSANGLP